MSSGSGASMLPQVSSMSFSVLLEISRILNTGLDMETLSICVRLCEQGINPEALSSVIKELRKATEALKVRDFYVSSF
uniref:Mitotic spindle organizing protein 1 n=2 Tax=Ursidae TaxID=9632 RepID=A0A452QYY8_URSAM